MALGKRELLLIVGIEGMGGVFVGYRDLDLIYPTAFHGLTLTHPSNV
jgi:hypothetical protein